MAQMLITEAQAQALLKNRSNTYNRKADKKRIFAEIRKDHGIPSGTKIKFFIESPDNPLYRVIRNKHTGLPLDNGIPDKVETPKPLVQATSPATQPPKAKPVKVAPTKKAAPAKKVAAKAPAKAPAKKAAPAKKVAAKAPAKAPAKVASGYPKDVRITVNGVRVRLGKAADAAAEKRLIAAYKRKHA